jgi:glycine C-acetyltransferase
MDPALRQQFADELDAIRAAGTFKAERVLETPQGSRVEVGGKEVLNFCANNYLGLADDPRIVAACADALERYGFGMASVRFICGTSTVHEELERALSHLLGTESTILYSSCFDANGGVFETVLTEADAVVSDQLNHASIIDGIRLCSARRLRYANRDMADLAAQLDAARGARRILIVTDGVFSMDGSLAPLDEICALADRHGAMVMVDDSHAVGVLGASGAGTPELFGVRDRVDIVSGTLGKALGGASGGYLSGRAEIVALCRQRSRPYLFSNSLAPSIAAAALTALEILGDSDELRERLAANARRLREGLRSAGFDVGAGEHPIVPVMIGDAARAAAMADDLLARGIYVIGFSYPVVPMGQARIRVQLSAAHTPEQIDRAVAAFVAARDATR